MAGNIYVCVKTVPDTDDIGFDSSTGNMIRTNKALKINKDDTVAIEVALRCNEILESNVEAISMGPKFYETGLRYALSMGVDEAHLITSKAFAGADVLATAYTLSQFIKQSGEYKLIVCGNHSSDGSTGQTGPELAELLGIRHAGYVSEIIAIDEISITVAQQFDELKIISERHLPCVIIPKHDFCMPRIPTLANVLKSKRH
ncbi:MAG: electron transfer flavoprotein subunit beta/FixA family protein, partial [Clostridia bacterium]|nr:electron transfer flavoprotein subunit beta/FixA family protein [Clostridia bacterium]